MQSGKQSEQPLHEEKKLCTKNKGATTCLGLLRPLKLSRKVLGLLALSGSADLPLGASRTSAQNLQACELFGSISSATTVKLLRPLN
jgi:hypothetical protein